MFSHQTCSPRSLLINACVFMPASKPNWQFFWATCRLGLDCCSNLCWLFQAAQTLVNHHKTHHYWLLINHEMPISRQVLQDKNVPHFYGHQDTFVYRIVDLSIDKYIYVYRIPGWWLTYPSEKSWSESQLGWHDIPNCFWKVILNPFHGSSHHQPDIYIYTRYPYPWRSLSSVTTSIKHQTGNSVEGLARLAAASWTIHYPLVI